MLYSAKIYNKPQVLLIAPHGSYRTMPFLKAAQQKNIDILIASEGEHSVVAAYAQGLHIDFSNPQSAVDKILCYAKQSPLAAVIATDDSTTELANRIATDLGLAHNSAASIQLARRKDLARECLKKSSLNVPLFSLIDLRQSPLKQMACVRFPLVVKPVGLSGSRGVIRANNERQLCIACEQVKNILRQEKNIQQKTEQERNFVLLEQFIEGDEIAIEGMLVNGEFQLLAIFDKPDPLNGPYFEETYYITPTKLSLSQQQQLNDTLQNACASYGLREGPIHAECRFNQSGFWVIEIAARTIGGLCARLLQFGTGMSLEQLVLSHAIGEPLPAIKPQHTAQLASGVLMIPIPKHGILKRIEGLLAARNVALIEDLTIQIQAGHEVIPLPEGSSYLGFIFARGDTAQQVELALRTAHNCLKIVIAPLLFKVKVA